MGWLQGLIALVQLINKLVDGARALALFIERNRNEKWFQDFGVAIERLESVDSNPNATDKEKEDALRQYLRVMRGFRS